MNQKQTIEEQIPASEPVTENLETVGDPAATGETLTEQTEPGSQAPASENN